MKPRGPGVGALYAMLPRMNDDQLEVLTRIASVLSRQSLTVCESLAEAPTLVLAFEKGRAQGPHLSIPTQREPAGLAAAHLTVCPWRKYGSAGDTHYYYRADVLSTRDPLNDTARSLVVCTLHVARTHVGSILGGSYVWNVQIIDTKGLPRFSVPRGEWPTLTEGKRQAVHELERIVESNGGRW